MLFQHMKCTIYMEIFYKLYMYKFHKTLLLRFSVTLKNQLDNGFILFESTE